MMPKAARPRAYARRPDERRPHQHPDFGSLSTRKLEAWGLPVGFVTSSAQGPLPGCDARKSEADKKGR